MCEVIFGLEDGIVSSGGVSIGIAAGTGDSRIVVLSGFVVVVVEALSMAAGSYLSVKSARQVVEGRVKMVSQEISADPEGKRSELREAYRRRGFGEAEAAELVRLVTRDPEVWLEELICKDLGIGLHEMERARGNSVVMWAANMAGGAVPLLPFLLLPIGPAIGVAFGLSLVTLFAIGWWKARKTGTSRWRGAFEMMAVAASAGVVGFLIGKIVASLTGVEMVA